MKEKLKVLDLFSGIGGFSLGLESTGSFETVAFCEIDTFCQKVLRKHWGSVPIYEDVRELSVESLVRDGIGRIDCITGGFPCQDVSLAGKRSGLSGKRTTLWSEFARLIREIKPRWVVAENVPGLLSSDNGQFFGNILRDLDACRYDAEWDCIPAAAIGAPHRRDRVWIVAYPNSGNGNGGTESRNRWANGTGVYGTQGTVTYPTCNRQDETTLSRSSSTREEEGWVLQSERCHFPPTVLVHTQSTSTQQVFCQKWWQQVQSRRISRGTRGYWAIEPAVGRVADGVQRRVDRLRSLGNAVVPQIVELIGHRIIEIETDILSHEMQERMSE